MLSEKPLDALAQRLALGLAALARDAAPCGAPDALRAAAEESARLFQGHAKARPSPQDARAAALAFLRGEDLDGFQLHLLAGALAERLAEAGGACVLGAPALAARLDAWRREAEAGELWRLTWFGLLASYFAFDPRRAGAAEREGWLRLRDLLQASWPFIERASGAGALPAWMEALRADPALLGADAARRYGRDCLAGDESAARQLAQRLGIPESSWFWHALVLAAVRCAVEQGDDALFEASVAPLVALIEERPVHRDEALEALLARCLRRARATPLAALRDFAVRDDVWRNPKLHALGAAPAWGRVGEDIRRMALQWVNGANVQDFFAVLAARNAADEGRLAFWSAYREQIVWTRCALGLQTLALAGRSRAVSRLVEREQGACATLAGHPDTDALLMQIGSHLVVEFSTSGHAGWVYDAAALPFDRYAARYDGGAADLERGLLGEALLRIAHRTSWETDAEQGLARLGIRPDRELRGRPA